MTAGGPKGARGAQMHDGAGAREAKLIKKLEAWGDPSLLLLVTVAAVAVGAFVGSLVIGGMTDLGVLVGLLSGIAFAWRVSVAQRSRRTELTQLRAEAEALWAGDQTRIRAELKERYGVTFLDDSPLEPGRPVSAQTETGLRIFTYHEVSGRPFLMHADVEVPRVNQAGDL